MIFTPPGEKPVPGPEYLATTRYFDWDNPGVRAYAEKTIAGESSPITKAVKLFYAVRDGWRYDPFSMRLDPDHYVASRVLGVKGAFCIPKAILLTALARAVGICAGIGMSDVVNHLTTEKLRARMAGQTTFIYHGYAVLYLEGAWVKAAPAFNIELCTRFGVRPTEFDGRSDAIFQEFDMSNRRHMEYIKDRGTWSDFPYEQVVRDFLDLYPAECFADDAIEEKFEDGVILK